jgi:ethanolamine ammonia-lyase small subunit
VGDPWKELRRLTPARVALGRAGPALPTREVLAFALDHARARDAVHLPFDAGAVAAQIEALGLATLTVASAAPDRATYLRRPDLGRRLAPGERARLEAAPARGADVALVIADGLSSAAVHAHAASLVAALAPRLREADLTLADVVLAHQARVALGDVVGAALGARIVVLLVGERPGLSSPDSLGAYVTLGPRAGRTDAERNCVSNIRPAGLAYDEAADRIAWLVGAALKLGATGVPLKDDSALGAPRLAAAAPAPLPMAEVAGAAFADPLTARIVAFIRQVGIDVAHGGPRESLLPGIAVEGGAILVDAARLAHPGDLLHEAGHLAVADPAGRAALNDVGDDPAEEMAAIAWSYAAARHLGLDPAVVFHPHGYRGGGDWLAEAFERGGGPGVPMLQWWGMTGGWKGEPPFPHMLRWLR